MKANHLETTIESYISRVEQQLAILGASDRFEFIDELKTHLELFVSENPDLDLNTQFGTPEHYAQELLQSSGQVVKNSGDSRRSKPQKILVGIFASLFLVFAAGAISYSGLLPEKNSEKFPVKDRYYTTPDLTGMNPEDVVQMLSVNRDNVPICDLAELLNKNLTNLEVVNQEPLPGEVINPAIQCISIILSK